LLRTTRIGVKQSRVTGTLAALQLFPGQLSQYYTRQSKVFNVINAIAGIQSQLQQGIDEVDGLPTSYNIMFISDMHLASTYPLVAQYAANFDVKLIINTGDESEFGTAAEMTPAYLAQLRALTEKTPMIWLGGNHDSPVTINVSSASNRSPRTASSPRSSASNSSVPLPARRTPRRSPASR